MRRGDAEAKPGDERGATKRAEALLLWGERRILVCTEPEGRTRSGGVARSEGELHSPRGVIWCG